MVLCILLAISFFHSEHLFLFISNLKADSLYKTLCNKKKIATMLVTKTQNFDRDDSKTLFIHCLLHVISLRGLGVKSEVRKSIQNVTQAHHK